MSEEKPRMLYTVNASYKYLQMIAPQTFSHLKEAVGSRAAARKLILDYVARVLDETDTCGIEFSVGTIKCSDPAIAMRTEAEADPALTIALVTGAHVRFRNGAAPEFDGIWRVRAIHCGMELPIQLERGNVCHSARMDQLMLAVPPGSD